MAREAMVTRTFKTAIVTALCANIEASTVSEEIFNIPHILKDDEAYIRYIAKQYNTKTRKVVGIKDVEVSEVLKGMPEQDFFDSARTLPPRKG